jgi:hypothetical protein
LKWKDKQRLDMDLSTWSDLKAEWDYYRAHQDEMVALYNGKYIVMLGNQVRGAFETSGEAYQFGVAHFEPGKFLLQKCSPGTKDYTVRFYAGLKI